MACTYTGTAWIVVVLSLLALDAVPVRSDQCTTDVGAFFKSNYTLELLQFEQANARSRDDIGNYISCTGVTGAHFCEIYSVGKDGRASTTGVCGPKSCNEQALMGPDGQLVLALVAGYTPASITGVRCLSNKTPPVEGSGAVGSVVVFSALAVIILACTGLHWWQTRARANQRERRPSNHLQDERAEPTAEAVVDKKQLSLVSLFVRELSLITSFKKLTQPAKLPMSLRMLDGMRALSMVWVIAGHTYLFGLTNMDNIFYAVRNVLSRYSFQVVSNGTLSVDTFFFLSGFLGAYVLHSKLRKRFATGGKLGSGESIPLMKQDDYEEPETKSALGFVTGIGTFITMLTHRYLRLTPLLGLLLLFYFHTMPLLGRGPYWWTLTSTYDPDGYQCGKYWWTNLLYINNLYPDQFEAHGSENLGCMGWTWYLANDMQLFCLIPIIMMVHLKCPKAGYALLTSLFVASMACIIGLGVHYGFYFCPLPADQNVANEGNLSYNKPWTRAVPYLLGAALALYIRDYKPKPKRPSFLGLVLWYTLAGFLCATPIFITFDARYSEGHQAGTCRWSHSAQIAWYCSYRLSWSVGLIMLALPGFFDWPNPITPILGSRIWTVPARLTFAAYLVHPIIMKVTVTANNGTSDYSDFAFIIDAGGYIFWSYIVAAFLYCFVESPFTLIDTLLFERVLSRKSDKPHSSHGGR